MGLQHEFDCKYAYLYNLVKFLESLLFTTKFYILLLFFRRLMQLSRIQKVDGFNRICYNKKVLVMHEIDSNTQLRRNFQIIFLAA